MLSAEPKPFIEKCSEEAKIRPAMLFILFMSKIMLQIRVLISVLWLKPILNIWKLIYYVHGPQFKRQHLTEIGFNQYNNSIHHKFTFQMFPFHFIHLCKFVLFNKVSYEIVSKIWVNLINNDNFITTQIWLCIYLFIYLYVMSCIFIR